MCPCPRSRRGERDRNTGDWQAVLGDRRRQVGAEGGVDVRGLPASRTRLDDGWCEVRQRVAGRAAAGDRGRDPVGPADSVGVNSPASATPCALVVTLMKVNVSENVPVAPEVGAVNVTGTPATGTPFWVTIAVRSSRKRH